MEKKATLNLRVDPVVKQKAENVLNQLGIPMSTAINMYLNQISLTGGIPFDVTLPMAPPELDASLMTDEELYKKLQKSVSGIETGKYKSVDEVMASHKAKYAEHVDEAV